MHLALTARRGLQPDRMTRRSLAKVHLCCGRDIKGTGAAAGAVPARREEGNVIQSLQRPEKVNERICASQTCQSLYLDALPHQTECFQPGLFASMPTHMET